MIINNFYIYFIKNFAKYKFNLDIVQKKEKIIKKIAECDFYAYNIKDIILSVYVNLYRSLLDDYQVNIAFLLFIEFIC